MPNYDFRCNECGYKFSQSVSYKEKDSVKCKECGGSVTQLFTGFLFGKSQGASAASGGGSSCSSKSCGGCSGC